MGYRPRTLRRAHDSWFRFVAQEGDLDADETRVLEAIGSWLDTIESSAQLDVLELSLLEVLLETDALATGLPLDELAERARAFLAGSPELLALSGAAGVIDAQTADPQRGAPSGPRAPSRDGCRIPPGSAWRTTASCPAASPSPPASSAPPPA